ncbi:hypothetical protein [Tateyamaria sp.]|uniref:hypothetical protein n=1 Tax=Tateyamaria sp. TaxID=1929288 RepID=UPI00327D7475
MTIRYPLILFAVSALAACQPAVPDSGAGVVDTGRGVGFDSPESLAARQARDAELSGTAIDATTSATQSAGTIRAVSDPAGLDAELAQVASQNDTDAARANSGQAVVNASPSNSAPVILNNPGISDENNFDAVASRQSIESDAARIASNRSQYEVIQPTALPTRSGSTQPNVVQYALETSHPRGTKVHRRTNIASASRTQRNCAQYNSADEAQIDFLAFGGPDRDRKALDPDGDGYACGWDPAPFRRASGG